MIFHAKTIDPNKSIIQFSEVSLLRSLDSFKLFQPGEQVCELDHRGPGRDLTNLCCQFHS